VNLRSLLEEFGAVGFGTREELFGDTSKRKNFLAVAFGPDSPHLAAIIHLVTRVIPLKAGLTE